MKRNNSQKLKEFLKMFDRDMITIDGHENAFMGVTNTPKKGYLAVYSTSQIIENLMREDLMDFEQAEEFVHKNIATKYYGDKTPLLLDIVPDCFWK